jgi:hypothetical protein
VQYLQVRILRPSHWFNLHDVVAMASCNRLGSYTVQYSSNESPVNGFP